MSLAFTKFSWIYDFKCIWLHVSLGARAEKGIVYSVFMMACVAAIAGGTFISLNHHTTMLTIV